MKIVDNHTICMFSWHVFQIFCFYSIFYNFLFGQLMHMQNEYTTSHKN